MKRLKAIDRAPPTESESGGKAKAASKGGARSVWNRILVPYDFSGTAREALDYALKLAGPGETTITLIHVVAPLIYPPEAGLVAPLWHDLVKASQKKLAGIAGAMEREGIVIKPLVRTGPPYLEIVRAAGKVGAQLIVISTHGFTGLKHVFLGSTAERVVRHARCPVLVVRGKGTMRDETD